MARETESGGRKMSDVLSEKIEGVRNEATTALAERDERISALATEKTELETRIAALEEKVKTRIIRGPEAGEDKPKPISFRKLFRGMVSNDWSESGYEREACQESVRALGASGDASGGYLVATQYMPQEFIDYLVANMVTRQAGGRELNGLMGSPVEIPRKTGKSTAYWTAENAAITASEMTFGNVTLQPHQCSTLTKVSNRLIRMSDPSIETLIREDLAETIGLELDRVALIGDGGDGEPIGIANTTGINTKSMNAVVTLALLEDMISTLEVDNALKGRLAWVFNPREWSIVRALLAAQQVNVRDPYGRDGVAGMLWGYPVYLSTQLRTNLGGATDEGEIFFGNWSDLLLGQWGAIEFAVSQHADTAFAANQTWIRATIDVDVAVRQPVSFCYCVDARVS
jgi:HK97 family phage major capsid protein